jgi:hypothetical protein
MESKPHAKDWLIFPENLGKRLSIDETALSNGELYTILTNKAAKEKEHSSYDCWNQLSNCHSYYRKKYRLNYETVSEITLDMAANMD